ncbi:MAG: hypothetical protein ACI9F2_000396 [Lysobacterales bacterium]|jgi:hypothetical protein
MTIEEKPTEFGPQPLIELLVELKLSNKDLVDVSTEQLSFKMLQKGAKGRKISNNIKSKILRSLNKLSSEKNYAFKDLFTY